VGHLFICQGNLTQLHCDAFLLPTDGGLFLTSSWTNQLPQVPLPQTPEDWGTDCRTMAWAGWPDELPTPWLTVVGAGAQSLEWYVDGALAFIRQAAQGRQRTERACPLLALPLVGTGWGGARRDKGGIVSALVPALLAEVANLNADVALVLYQPEAFAACQLERKKHESWPELSDEIKGEARRLAVLALSDQLAFFLGAGVSKGAGLPDWKQLLERLSEGSIDRALYEAMEGMSLLDKAQLLHKRKGADLRGDVAAVIRQGKHCSLCHTLLAAIPHREVVTQNYDCLFEQACEAAGHELSILPYHPVPGRRWLLKMHGCVNHPQDIVLSREDFLRYSKTRGALAGLVQGLLLTRHLVFVGFSLTDDNFLIIMDEVRRARNASTRMGSALLLEMRQPLRELWQDELDLIALATPRRLELFLDLVLAEATNNAQHLLDPTYAKLLSPEEIWLKDQLIELRSRAPAEVKALPAWKTVQALMDRLGDDTERRKHRGQLGYS